MCISNNLENTFKKLSHVIKFLKSPFGKLFYILWMEMFKLFFSNLIVVS